VHKAATYLDCAGQSLDRERVAVLQAPKLVKRPYTVKGANGETREDYYYWLRMRMEG